MTFETSNADPAGEDEEFETSTSTQRAMCVSDLPTVCDLAVFEIDFLIDRIAIRLADDPDGLRVDIAFDSGFESRPRPLDEDRTAKIGEPIACEVPQDFADVYD